MLVLARITEATALAVDKHKKQNSSHLVFVIQKLGISSVLLTEASLIVCAKKASELGRINICLQVPDSFHWLQRKSWLPETNIWCLIEWKIT